MGRNVRLENLTKRFGTLNAVDRVNLEIEEGEFICFLGPSGCGKTTVLRMITGFETVTEGKVIFDGKNAYFINHLISSYYPRFCEWLKGMNVDVENAPVEKSPSSV